MGSSINMSATSELLVKLPTGKVNKDHPLTAEESKSRHPRTNLSKRSATKIKPANAFWVICVTGECAQLDLRTRTAQRYCSWGTAHKKSLHPKVKKSDMECLIDTWFEFANNGHSWGTEYLQLEELNRHSYKYFGGDLIEIKIDNSNENVNMMDNENHNENNQNKNDNQQQSTDVAINIANKIVDKLMPKLKASMRPSKITGFLNNTVTTSYKHNNNNSNNNNNSENSGLVITSNNFMEFVECEGKHIFAMKFDPRLRRWSAHCISCHTFGTTKHTWTIGKTMTAAEASDHKFFWDQVASIRKHVSTQSHRDNTFKLRKKQTKENSCLQLKADIAQLMQRHSLPAILFEEILLLFFKEKKRSKCSCKDICVIGNYQHGSATAKKWNDISEKYLNQMLTFSVISRSVTSFNLVFFSGSMDGWSIGSMKCEVLGALTDDIQSQKCYLLQLSEYAYGEEKENNVKDTESCVRLFFDACKTLKITPSLIENEMELYDDKPIIIFRNFCTDGPRKLTLQLVTLY